MSLACYFDCDGTLVEYDGAYADLFADACARSGLDDVDSERLFGAYDAPFFEAFQAFASDPYREGAAAAFEACEVDAQDVDPARFAEHLRDVEVERSVVRAGTRETLDRLADDHALGVLTNGLVDQQRRKLRHNGLFERFDAYLPSYEVGAHKPDPRVFAAARERLPADEHVYVGDSVDHDVTPAREAGFRTVHVDATLDDRAVAVGSVGALGRLADLF